MLLLLFACASPLPGFSITPLEGMPTVLEVRWENTGADEARVEVDDGRVLREAGSTDAVHRALVPGYAGGATVRLRAVERWGDDWVEGPWESADTGLLPSGLPSLQLTQRDTGAAEGWVLTSALGTQRGLMVLNREGEIVWYEPLADHLVAPDVEPLLGGGGFATLVSAADHITDLGELRIFDYSGQLIQGIRAPLGHHMFEQIELGRFAYLSLDVREVEGQSEPVVGDALRVLDVHGGVQDLYTVWDHFTFDPSFDGGNFYPEGLDWMHANGLSWSPERRSFLLSYRMFDGVVEVDLASGEPLDAFGGLGDRPFAGGDAFLSQHAPTWTPDGNLLVFDNREPFTTDTTRVAEYAVGEDLELRWSHAPIDGYVVTTLGSAQRLENGNTLISTGSGGVWQEVDPDGEVVWEVRGEAGVVAGNALLLESW